MKNSKPTILVLGVTGQVGQSVIPALLADPTGQVVAAARSRTAKKELTLRRHLRTP